MKAIVSLRNLYPFVSKLKELPFSSDAANLPRMQPALSIPPPPWMIDDRSRRVIQALGGMEEEPLALFVGGCVRNTLLGKPVTDIDIATKHRPDAVMGILLNSGIRAIPTGLDHGTVTGLLDDVSFEITSLRKDVETDGRHAVIAFTDQWEEDALRRDFTMNTLLAAPDGRIFDPTGEGVDHLEQRRVVFVGKAEDRIAEDYLRILRFFRFHAQYGEGAPDPAAMQACEHYAGKIRELSRERITGEVMKILSVRKLAPVLDSMFDHHVLTALRCKGYNPAHIQHLCDLQIRFEQEDPLARLYFLAGFNMDVLESWVVLPNAQKDYLELIERAYDGLKAISRKKMREMVYLHGNQAVFQAYLMRLAIKGYAPDLEMIDVAKYWQAPSFPVSGKILMDKGMAAGPELGQKLKTLEAAWIKSDFSKLPRY